MYLYLYLYLYHESTIRKLPTLFSQSRACKQHKVGLYLFINIWLISSHRCPV
jgi:hypothetical protein